MSTTSTTVKGSKTGQQSEQLKMNEYEKNIVLEGLNYTKEFTAVSDGWKCLSTGGLKLVDSNGAHTGFTIGEDGELYYNGGKASEYSYRWIDAENEDEDEDEDENK